MSGIEQRRHPRIEVTWPAAVTNEAGHTIEGMVIDASEGGLGFVSKEICEAGQLFHVNICVSTSFTSKHHVLARYKCVHSRGISSTLGNYKAGMQLVAIQADDLDLLVKGLFENAKSSLYS